MLSSTLQEFPWRKVDVELGEVVGVELFEPAIENGFCRGDELDDGARTFVEMAIDLGNEGRKLERKQDLAEEALLAAFEARSRRGLGHGVAGFVLDGIDDPGDFERVFEIAVNDALSRGSGNAEERGVTGEFP
jgi:hypothetical protein